MHRKLVTLIAIVALALCLGGAPSAGAQAGDTAVVMVVTGTGSYGPGLTTPPPISPAPIGIGVTQYWAMNGVVVTTFGMVHRAPTFAGVANCTASATSTLPETFFFGAGAGTMSCSTGTLAGYSASLIYTRAGTDATITLQGGLNGQLDCAFQPDQTPPATVTSFHVTCAGLVTGS